MMPPTYALYFKFSIAAELCATIKALRLDCLTYSNWELCLRKILKIVK